MPRVLKDIRIKEVSAVDRGAGRGVKVMLIKRDDPMTEPYWKRDFTQEQRDEAAKTGAAMPDGSFPIKNGTDLENAIHAIGRAKDPAKAKAHIKTRARALGMTDKLPDTWKRDTTETDMTKEEMDKAIAEAVTKATTDLTKKFEGDIAKRDAEIAVLKMSDAHKAYMAQMDGDADDAKKKAFAAMSPAERDAHMQKNPIKKRVDPVVEADLAKRDETIAKQAKEIEELRKRQDAADLKEAQADFKKRAADLGLDKDGDGEIMRKAFAGDKEAQIAFEKRQVEVRKALQAQVDTGVIFKEFGTGRGAAGGAYEQLTAKADELRKAEKTLTPEQAFAKVYEDPANRDVVALYKREEAAAKAKAPQ